MLADVSEKAGWLRIKSRDVNFFGKYSGSPENAFKVAFSARLRPGEELMEYICQENNQDVAHIQGPARIP